MAIPGAIIIFLAGLTGIPTEVYEAASIDGANAWMKFRRITFPLLSGFLVINTILTSKNFLNVYDIVVGLTGGGPGTATTSVAQTIFSGFFNGDYAYQMANAVIFFAITLLFSAFIRGIPVELEESARLDGCTTWQTFRRIVLPLLAPISATVGIFAFLQSWNDFMMPQLITANPKFQSLPVVQYLFQDQFTTNLNVALRVVSHALAPDPGRLPHRAALGRQRHHAGLDQVSTASTTRPVDDRHRADADWWRQAVVYQIYPRSFADSDGNGLGDLQGVSSRVPYLAALGIDAVWLSPFYPSALADGGYDVDDYRDVDPRLGTLADFDEMTARLHARKIKVIVDIVPNHTSNRHPWFLEAVAAPAGSPARDRYIFRDGVGPDGERPPSDWASMFGGPVWTRVPDGQWYLHLFTPQQPDLNWANREVRDDFLTTLRFWSDRGVDGFRVDVAHGLANNLTEPLASLPVQGDIIDGSLPPGSHPLWDRDEVHDIYAEWRHVFNEYDPPRSAVAEAWVHPSWRPRYASPEGLGQAFNFDLLDATWSSGEFLRVITDNISDAQQQGSSTTWVLSNHDVVRHATRYGLPPEDRHASARTWLLTGGTSPRLDRGLGLRRARAAVLLILALPGSAYLYQGEELGLHEVPDIPADLVQDPVFSRSRGAEKGRDGCRVPLPWTAGGASFGFGSGAAHLPQPAWFGPLSVEAQERDPASTLSLYRNALHWRRQLQAAENMEWLPGTNGQELHFARPGGWRCVTNFGPGPVPLPGGAVILTSVPVTGSQLPADTTAWLISR